MDLSHMVRMPDLSTLEIPSKQYLIALSDDAIFHDLRNLQRQLAVRQGSAAPGDYVLAQATGKSGVTKTIHIELGKKHFPDYENALLGCMAGQTIQAAICGEETAIQVQTVKQVVEISLTDETIAALNLPGIETLVEYRRQYIRDHGEEKAEQIFHAIQGKLIKQLVQRMEVALDEGEMEQFHQQQRAMIQSISEDVDQRLMDAYGGNTPQESDRLFFEENKRTFQLYVWGKTLAQQNNRQMTDAERQQVLEYYEAIHGKSEEQILAEGLMEEASQSFYMQYGIGEVKKYYKSLARFSAIGIPSQAL